MQIYGIDAMIRIFSHFAFIYLAFWALQSLRIENIFRKNMQTQIRMLYIFVAILIGYTASSFFLEVIALMKNFILTYI